MKITNKQQEEIDFLSKTFNVTGLTQEEKEQYINSTVNGIGKISCGGLNSGQRNRLFEAKRKLDINIKMWREDLTTGLLSSNELKEDFNCPYGDRLVDSIINSVTRDYRFKTLSKGTPTTLFAFLNFPKVK